MPRGNLKYLQDDTIAALSTPAGASPEAIVRLSGARAIEIADSIFRNTVPLSRADGRTIHSGILHKEGRDVARASAGVWRAPASYTGEDIVEFFIPGSPPLVTLVLTELTARGARPAGPGEFTRRAFLNGKLPLAAAETVQSLISATSEDERRAAMALRTGVFPRRMGEIRRALIDTSARLELGIDFAEDDITIISGDEAAARIRIAIGEISGLEKNARGELRKEDMLTAVFYGPTGAGKSSLFNLLAGEARAIVSTEDGTTRDYIEAELELGGYPVRLIDTAGEKAPKDYIEEVAVALSRERAEEGAVILFTYDFSAELGEEEFGLLAKARGKRFIVLANKFDLTSSVDARLQGVPYSGEIVFTSAVTGDGIERVKAALTAFAKDFAGSRGAPGFLLLERYSDILSRAGESLGRALAAIEGGLGDECAASDLREAAEALGEITGETVISEEVLDYIFNEFCIGK